MLEDKTKEPIIEEEIIEKEEDKPTSQDNSTIKQMRQSLKDKTNKLKELEEAVKSLKDKDVEKTYGLKNKEDAIKLINAGFDEERIKSMLGITNQTTDIINPNDLGLIPNDNNEPVKEEETEEDKELNKFKEQLDNLDK